jgi:hypothetical protein
MNAKLRIAGKITGAGALAGAGFIASNWIRYGRPVRNGKPDALLDRFMPAFDVREYHQTAVAAPATITYAAARDMDIFDSRLVRAIFRGREILMNANAPARQPQPLLQETLALGWGILAEEPGREIVVGAVTRPWEANVRFQSVPADEFAAFNEPGFVKIAWTLVAEPAGEAASEFRTETRVVTTDACARSRFRRYWAVMSPGIALIRRQSLGLVRADAEALYQARLNDND